MQKNKIGSGGDGGRQRGGTATLGGKMRIKIKRLNVPPHRQRSQL